jgi:hypothetical protein
MLHVPMGQISDRATGLAAIAESEVSEFFRQVTWSDLHGCRDCDLRANCSRCFGSAVAEVGDMLAPYRAACELAVARYLTTVGKRVVVAPDPGCPADRDLAVGPYRIDPAGNVRPISDQMTERDLFLRERYPWLRASREDLEASACGVGAAHREHGLVRLRRKAESSLDGARIPE